MADMDFSQAFTYSDIQKVYLIAVELENGAVSQHGSVQLERIFQDSTLYAQVTALKNEMESILQNFTGASEYDSTATYAVGDYCTRNDYLYQCSTAVSAESWDPTKWDVVTISSQYSEVYTMLKNILGVDDYSTSASYAVGDLVVHDGKLYRCTTAVSGGAWDASKWSETDFVAESESIMTEIQTEGAAQVANIQSVYAEDLGNVSSRVQSNSKRIANLEDKSAPYTIEYPNTDYGKGDIPANVEKGAVVKSVDGNTRAWIQLMNKSTYGSTKTENGITFTNNGDGSITVSGIASANTNFRLAQSPGDSMSALAGHKYMILGCPSGGSSSTYKLYDNYYGMMETGSGHIWTQASDRPVTWLIVITSGTDLSTAKIFKPCVYDLTVIYGAGNEPSTVAEAIDQIPALGRFNTFDDGSLVKLKVGGYRSVGPNIWDEEWELGYYSTLTGAKINSTDRICSKNYIPIRPGTAYYFLGQFATGVCYYDINKNFISSAYPDNESRTTPSNAYYLRFALGSYYGTTYNHDIQICLNSLPDAVKQTYHPHKSQTVEFSSPVELGKAGSVKDRLDTLDNVVKRNVGSVIVTDSNLSTGSDNGTRALFSVDLEDDINYTDASATPNISAFGLTAVSQNSSWVAGNCSASTSSSTKIYLIFATGTTRAEVLSYFATRPILYELASPTTEEISVPSAIEVEPYGTIELIQVQDVEIDTEFSVQYIPDSQYLTKSMVVDSLSSESTDVPLSANQGRILAEKIARNTKEIANLIQKEGVVSISYPDSIYGRGEVPANMAKFAEVSTLRGVSRVWNQLVPLDTTKWTSENVLGSVSSQTIVVKPSTDSTGVYKRYKLPVQSGHTYLVSAKVKTSNANYTAGVALRNSNGTIIQENTSSTTLNPIVFVASTTGSDTHFDLQVQPAMQTSEHGEFAEVILRDLTVYFSGSIPSDAQTLADIQQNYPELLEPRDYDAGSLVSTTYDAVESEGRNLFDKDSAVEGYQLSSTGEPLTQASMCYSDKMTVIVGETYTISGAGNVLNYASKFIFGYDGDDNLLQTVSADNTGTGTITIANGVAYIRVNCVLAYIDTCQLELGSTATSYSPHFKSTLTLPSPVALPSAGSVADTDELCVEVSEGVFKRRKTQRVGKVDLGTIPNWVLDSDGFYRTTLDDILPPSGSSSIRLTCDKYVPTSPQYSGGMSGQVDKTICQSANSSGTTKQIYVKDSGGTPTGILNYALAEESVTLTDPILDNFVLTEAGGTITPKQTQSKQIDTRFDIDYQAL